MSFETAMTKADLAEILNKKIYPSTFSIFDNAEYSIPTRYEYSGYADQNGFLVRRRSYYFDSKIPNPNIKGTFYENNGKTVIKIEFTPTKYFIIGFVLIPIPFIFFIASVFVSSPEMSFILLIPLIIVISHYFAMKRNIKRGKYDFERELNFTFVKNNGFRILN
ncbi:hypothetical protein [Chryseobacterium sp. Leaf180]|uniref:hypothetical protein n=1 Tax=Chryseobacterium sp. Leaf180 TaxID=1736289 RepID=UPI001EE69A46|nr:hypothetical protein [Chryseobacterium sp. Leaf180]